MGKVKNFPPYEEARKIAIEKGIKSKTGYLTMYKELGLPCEPNKTYKDRWIDWAHFLGKKTTIFPPYEEAKRSVMEKGIKSEDEYRLIYKELGLPSAPNITYKDKGWINWSSFWGKTIYPPYEEAKRSVMENGIKSKTGYLTMYKELGLPSAPNDFYKDKGWIDWDDFLGRPHKTTPMERKTKVLSKMALNPILLGDKAPLQIIYMLATNMDKELASEIEILLNMTSCEDRLNWVKEQLKTLKVDAPTTSDTSSETLEDEIPAIESMLEIFEDSMDDLTDEDSISIKTILENYYHNVVNKELIEEFDD